MSNYGNLPAPSPEAGLSRYLTEIRKFPLLEPEEEYMLAKRWVEDQDTEAAHRMVTSHLRLAAKIAMGYRGYGLPQAEVISEANVGLMQAVKRFDPEKGFRLATYAMWWIRASIQEYILRSWSLVKLGTTSAQKKLFFNLRKAKSAHRRARGRRSAARTRAEDRDRSRRDRGRGHLDEPAPVGRRCLAQRDRRAGGRRHDAVAGLARGRGRRPGRGLRRAATSSSSAGRCWPRRWTCSTTARSDILTQRRLTDQPVTLEDLSGEYDVSRERIRQIEVRAFEKLQKRMRELAQGAGDAGARPEPFRCR